MSAIGKLKKEDKDEYRALKESCGDEAASSLGGFPLALVQAETYIARFESSLQEFRNVFMKMSRMGNLREIMKKSNDIKLIQESHRSIWTTWKITAGQLSEKAWAAFRAMAMLAPSGVGEAISTLA